jgi:hypothetical protein
VRQNYQQIMHVKSASVAIAIYTGVPPGAQVSGASMTLVYIGVNAPPGLPDKGNAVDLVGGAVSHMTKRHGDGPARRPRRHHQRVRDGTRSGPTHRGLRLEQRSLLRIAAPDLARCDHQRTGRRDEEHAPGPRAELSRPAAGSRKPRVVFLPANKSREQQTG